MSLRTRPVRRDDIPAIVAFTRNTFVWGDYVPDVIADWIEEDDAVTYVAVDPDDVPVGVARGQLLSPAEVWYGAARVRSDRRGEGIAGDLARALLDWSRRRGARVGRLLVEDWNEASHRQVAKSGMRPVAHVDRCTRTVGDASPAPGGNGGRRLPARLRPRPARAAEAEPAYASWSVGELGRALRGLFAVGWSFRRLTVEDLVAAARAGAFWEIGAGWAVASRAELATEVGWLETREEDADAMILALLDLAATGGSEELVLWLPALPWLVRAARRRGFERHPMTVYAIDLDPA